MPFWQAICFWWTCTEVLLSTVVHTGFAVLLLLRAVWRDFYGGARGGEEAAAGIGIAVQELAVGLAEGTKNLFPKNGRTGSPPIVLVHGIFGFGKERLGGISYWGGCELKEGVVVSDVGALASIWDRACELFYQIKGGTVDYGEEHSIRCGHSRYGRTYPGFYPEWDAKHPVHFLGHSSGVQTVRLLHNMLAEGRFATHPETDEEWILSLTSLSGALNGTTRVYLDGISPLDGRSIKPFSLLQVLVKGVLLYDFLDISFLKKYYDFGFDHFGLSWKTGGLFGLAQALLGLKGPFATGDWILPDLSIQSTAELNKRLKTYPKTYYFSVATAGTKQVLGRHIPASPCVHPLMFLRMLQMGGWRRPSDAPLPYHSFKEEEWYENDGALNLVSQLYPMIPSEHPHCPLPGGDFKDGQVLQPGVWYYKVMKGDHIHFVLSAKRAGDQYHQLWDGLFKRCHTQLLRDWDGLSDICEVN